MPRVLPLCSRAGRTQSRTISSERSSVRRWQQDSGTTHIPVGCTGTCRCRSSTRRQGRSPDRHAIPAIRAFLYLSGAQTSQIRLEIRAGTAGRTRCRPRDRPHLVGANDPPSGHRRRTVRGRATGQAHLGARRGPVLRQRRVPYRLILDPSPVSARSRANSATQRACPRCMPYLVNNRRDIEDRSPRAMRPDMLRASEVRWIDPAGPLSVTRQRRRASADARGLGHGRA